MIRSLLLASLLMSLSLISCVSIDNENRGNVNDLVLEDQEYWLRKVNIRTQKSPHINRLVIFGDSLSDINNLKSNSFGRALPPQFYWRGRFSNGPIWVDYASSVLNLPVRDFAVGGAQTSETSGFKSWFIDNLHEQFEHYMESTSAKQRSQDLVVIWIGANNYFSNENDKPSHVTKDIHRIARKLLSSKVSHLVIGTMPELAYVAQPPGKKPYRPDSEFLKIRKAHNSLIKKLMTKLRQEFPNKAVVTFEAYRIYRQVTRVPEDYGFLSHNKPCYPGDVFGEFLEDRSICSKFMSTFSWDYLHPNTMMHCYYASQFIYDVKHLFPGLNVDLKDLTDRCYELKKQEETI